MYLQIGNLFLKVIDLTRFERETVWTPDGADLESVRLVLGVTATYTPGGTPALPSVKALAPITQRVLDGTDRTAARVLAAPRGDPPAYPLPAFEGDGAPVKEWHAGPQTDAELRLHLLRPRQKLILWVYDRQTGNPIRWVESPRAGMRRDVGNGPRPLSCDIVSAQGEPTSVTIHYQIETEMSPCPEGSDKLVLSHRWEMTHTHDENYYMSRVIAGQIRFNRAVLEHRNMTPDVVRAQFIHPIPLGFQRTVPIVTQSSDGLTVRYRIVDTDPTIVFDPGVSGASRMNITEKTITAQDWTL